MSVLFKVRSRVQCNSYKNHRNRKTHHKIHVESQGMLNSQNSVLLAPLLKIIRPYVGGFISGVCSVPWFICLSLFQHHTCDYGSFVVS